MNQTHSYSRDLYQLAHAVRQQVRTAQETLCQVQGKKDANAGLPLMDAFEARLVDYGNEAYRPALIGLAALAYYVALHDEAHEDFSRLYYLSQDGFFQQVRPIIVPAWQTGESLTQRCHSFFHTYREEIDKNSQTEGYKKDVCLIHQTLDDIDHVLSGTFKPLPIVSVDRKTGELLANLKPSDIVLKQLSHGKNLHTNPMHPLPCALAVLRAAAGLGPGPSV